MPGWKGRGHMRENKYQSLLITRIKNEFPGSLVLKNDSSYIQGIPDLTILHGDRWAVLEVKNRKGAPKQPNQKHYVKALNEMSYSSFIYPENEEDVFNELQSALRSGR